MTADLAQFAGRAVARDDLDLVHATQDGDVSAFEQLVERYDRKLVRIAEHITHNREDSQDAVQEAFLKAFQHVGDFREDSQFSTWLIRITVNQALMKLRKQRTTKEVSLDEDFQADGDMLPREVTDWAPNPEELYWASELRDILIKALDGLRPILRTVFVLRDIEGLSTDHTAEILDLSPAAVKARLWRARLQLCELLSEAFSKHKEPAHPSCLSFPELGRMVGSTGKCSVHHTVSTTRPIRNNRLSEQTGWTQASRGRNHGVPV